MQRSFRKATLISLAVYAAAVLMGFWGGFQITLFVVPVFQIIWTLFCVIRIVQLRRDGAYKTDAPQHDRESYGFWSGGLVSSTALFVVIVILTQAV
ncbi:MAG: hypothetical protein ABFD86_10830 [Bryobacteraceae bacterium]